MSFSPSFSPENINTRYDNGNTLLHLSIYENLWERVEDLLQRGANPNNQNIYGDTPLHLAVINRSTDTVRLLLEYGADPNIQNKYGETALYLALMDKLDNDVVDLLLKFNADPNIRDKSGNTPLHVVSNIESAQLLLKAGADPNNQNIYGNTPLHRASSNNWEMFVELLLEYEADPCIRNKKRKLAKDLTKSREIQTLLDYKICEENHEEPDYSYVEEYYSASAIKPENLNVQYEDGNTLLHISIDRRLFEGVPYLLQKGVNPNIQNYDGDTPLHIVAKMNIDWLVPILLKYGADPYIQNKEGETVLDVASSDSIRDILMNYEFDRPKDPGY